MASRKQKTMGAFPEWLTYSALGIVCGLVCLGGVFFGLNAKRGWEKAAKLSSENDVREQRIHRELYDQQQLTKEIAYYSTPTGQEAAARRKRYAKSGETILIVSPHK